MSLNAFLPHFLSSFWCFNYKQVCAIFSRFMKWEYFSSSHFIINQFKFVDSFNWHFSVAYILLGKKMPFLPILRFPVNSKKFCYEVIIYAFMYENVYIFPSKYFYHHCPFLFFDMVILRQYFRTQVVSISDFHECFPKPEGDVVK